jgi:hypothetical protein
MATIETKQPRQNTGIKRMSKKSTAVDLTPMVDLGFLLITFFVFTTTMARATVMKVNEPNDSDPAQYSDICASCALTLVPGSNNEVYYYEGMAGPETVVKKTGFGPEGLRSLILRKKAALAAQNDPTKKLTLIIKPGDGSNLQHLVDLLDETLINNVPLYFFAEPDADDKRMLPGVWP